MSLIWERLGNFIKVLLSYFISVARLIFWTFILFLSGLQKILFTRSEIVEVSMKLAPLRCDVVEMGDKLAYIDKLCIENPELAEVAYEDSEEDDIPFNGEDE